MKPIRIILLINLTESFGRNVIRGIKRYSDIFGPWSFCKIPPIYDKYSQDEIIAFAEKWQAHGIIGQFNTDHEVNRFLDKGLHVIAVDFKQQFTEVSNISGDYIKSGELAANYFLSKGYKHFAFYGNNNAVWSRQREKGFKETLKQRGHAIATYFSKQNKNHKFWYYTPSPLQDWLLSLPKPTAIFACDDNRAEHVLEAAKLAKLHVPEELAVLGVDNDEIICHYTIPPLSSIVQDEENGGFRAAELMHRMVNENQIIKEDIILNPIQIISRRSTESMAIDDPHIKKILIFISENLDKPLNVTDLVELVPLSRRGLEKKFLKEIGHSLYSEIQYQRMEKVITLLLDSNLSINEISMVCGY
ncbi:MAG: DNA-binding transcriptional regulator, partial [Fulvivirga sp.]|nr:DNA-binding transcriptional regulator [Fulvivirga sp.]